MSHFRQSRLGLWAATAVASIALGVALFAQLQVGLKPCPWCVLQRLFDVLIVVSGLLSVLPGALWASCLGVLACSVAGFAAASWQAFGPIQSGGCALTLADRIMMATGLDEHLPTLFSATASCDEANVPFLGLPFAVWSMFGFALTAGLAIWSGVHIHEDTAAHNSGQ
jgi:disulfide bond formation protein DsbB